MENKEYQEYVTELTERLGGVTPRNDELRQLFSEFNLQNLYGSVCDNMQIKENSAISEKHVFESGNETTRHFADGLIYWSVYTDHYSNEPDYTEDNVKAFIAETNPKISLRSYSCDYDIKRGEEKAYEAEVRLSFSEDVTPDEVIDMAIALNKEYGLNANNMVTVTSVTFTDEIPATLFGDLDLDDKQGMSDIVFLTKYTASPELYPITDKTALANADVNQDGKIDSLDTNILIEMTLGSFESAV